MQDMQKVLKDLLWLGSIDLTELEEGTQPNSLRKLLIKWLKKILSLGSYTNPKIKAIFLVTD